MKIIQQRKKCIGCGNCAAVCPKFWEIGADGKANLKGAKETSPGVFELEVDDPGCNKQAETSCPVGIIQVKKG